MISNNKQENFFKLSQNFMFPNTHLTETEKEEISHIPILQRHNFSISEKQEFSIPILQMVNLKIPFNKQKNPIFQINFHLEENN